MLSATNDLFLLDFVRVYYYLILYYKQVKCVTVLVFLFDSVCVMFGGGGYFNLPIDVTSIFWGF
jgi:hypothetical protein